MTDTSSSRQAGVTEPPKAVAVLGAGIMGSAMARRLAAAGLRTTVWDRSPQATAQLAAAGALAAVSARDAVAGADVVIISCPPQTGTGWLTSLARPSRRCTSCRYRRPGTGGRRPGQFSEPGSARM